MAINTKMQPRDWGMLLLLSLLWGGSFFFVGVAVAELPPFTIVLCRVGFAAATLWLIMFIIRVPLPKTPALWGSFFIMGFTKNALPFSLIVWGQTQISSGLASILNATTPLFTVLIAAVLLADERLNAGKAIGVALGIGGTIVMIGPAALQGASDNALAMLAVLGATLSYAFASIYGRRFHADGMPPITAAAGQVTCATILLTPLTLIVDTPWQLPLPSAPVILAVLGLAILSTALAYVLYFRILASSGAVNISLVTFLVPISAIFLGIVILDETLELSHIAGMVLIATGLIAMDGRVWRAIKS